MPALVAAPPTADWFVYRHISKRKIDIFILELGINDAFRGVPIDEIESNLQAIIDKVKARNPNVHIVIAGMQLPNYTTD